MTDGWIKQPWCSHTMGRHSATGRGGVLPFATTWTDPEITTLSEISQTKLKTT